MPQHYPFHHMQQQSHHTDKSSEFAQHPEVKSFGGTKVATSHHSMTHLQNGEHHMHHSHSDGQHHVMISTVGGKNVVKGHGSHPVLGVAIAKAKNAMERASSENFAKVEASTGIMVKDIPEKDKYFIPAKDHNEKLGYHFDKPVESRDHSIEDYFGKNVTNKSEPYFVIASKGRNNDHHGETIRMATHHGDTGHKFVNVSPKVMISIGNMPRHGAAKLHNDLIDRGYHSDIVDDKRRFYSKGNTQLHMHKDGEDRINTVVTTTPEAGETFETVETSKTASEYADTDKGNHELVNAKEFFAMSKKEQSKYLRKHPDSMHSSFGVHNDLFDYHMVQSTAHSAAGDTNQAHLHNNAADFHFDRMNKSVRGYMHTSANENAAKTGSVSLTYGKKPKEKRADVHYKEIERLSPTKSRVEVTKSDHPGFNVGEHAIYDIQSFRRLYKEEANFQDTDTNNTENVGKEREQMQSYSEAAAARLQVELSASLLASKDTKNKKEKKPKEIKSMRAEYHKEQLAHHVSEKEHHEKQILKHATKAGYSVEKDKEAEDAENSDMIVPHGAFAFVKALPDSHIVHQHVKLVQQHEEHMRHHNGMHNIYNRMSQKKQGIDNSVDGKIKEAIATLKDSSKKKDSGNGGNKGNDGKSTSGSKSGKKKDTGT